MELKQRAAELAGRAVEVLATTDGMFIVDYMRFDQPPPPKGATEEGALQGFIVWLEAYKTTEQGRIEDALAKEV